MDRLLLLRCPLTRQSLTLLELAEAERISGPLHARPGTPFGRTERVLLRTDRSTAYPVLADGVPVLLPPEALTRQRLDPDLQDRRWSEAYEEMAYYNAEATWDDATVPGPFADLLAGHTGPPPFPAPEWVDAAYDAAAQLDAYRHLGLPNGQRVAQLGGRGGHAVKTLVAGAAEAWLVTPMLNEARYANQLADRIGVAGRFAAVVAVAEHLPFRDRTFDTVYSGGSLHHMATEFAAPEIHRVLVPGGRFAAAEPWRTTLHRVGTRLLGKRERGVQCRPLDQPRLEPIQRVFYDVKLAHHGPFLRYLALALQKATRRTISVRAGLRLARIDDALPIPDFCGGSLAVLARRR